MVLQIESFCDLFHGAKYKINILIPKNAIGQFGCSVILDADVAKLYGIEKI